MPISKTPSPLGKIKAFILITFAGLAIQVNAADENQPTSATEAAATNQPGQQDIARTDDTSGDQEQVMEEITVIGQKQIFSLRQQVIMAEDHAFDIFNTLNDDNDYDVHCVKVARTGTRIRRRMCLPNFYHRATADEAQEFLGFVGTSNYIPVVPSARNVFADKFPIFKDKVKKLAMQNPEMLEALHKLFVLSEELKKTRDTYHGVEDK